MKSCINVRQLKRIWIARKGWIPVSAPTTVFAALKKIEASLRFERIGNKQEIYVILENSTAAAAFFIDLNVIGKKSGMSVLPIYWNDNYISLLPHSKRILEAHFLRKDLGNDELVLKVNGWNVKGMELNGS